jgi:hypothetical protein
MVHPRPLFVIQVNAAFERHAVGREAPNFCGMRNPAQIGEHRGVPCSPDIRALSFR